MRSPPTCSIVTTEAPSISATGVTQLRTGSPSRWTVHAPHRAAPQPYFVPVRLSESRSTQSSGVVSSTSAVTLLPLTLKLAIGFSPLDLCCPVSVYGIRTVDPVVFRPSRSRCAFAASLSA